MGKPKRIVSQKTTDTICTYAATVNLAGSKAKFGTHSDFVAWFKNHYKKKMITKERTAMYERRVAKLKFKGEEAKQELKKIIKEYWKNLWARQYSPGGGLTVQASLDAMTFFYECSPIKIDLDTENKTPKDFSFLTHATISLVCTVKGQNPFYHLVAIKEGMVFFSCILNDNQGNTLNHNGVYPWKGKFYGYEKVIVSQVNDYGDK